MKIQLVGNFANTQTHTRMMDPEQLFLGGVFTTMGLGTMLFPGLLLPISLKNHASSDSADLTLTFRCFGAQATLCGLILLSLRPTAKFYRNFGLAILPFFVFDYMAWHNDMITTFGALGDAAGNIVFTGCSYIGWKRTTEKGDLD